MVAIHCRKGTHSSMHYKVQRAILAVLTYKQYVPGAIIIASFKQRAIMAALTWKF